MNYLLRYFYSFIGVISLTGFLNWFIDPYGMFWSPQLSNINNVKPEAGSRSRITKAYQINNISPQILLVGNSRIEMGLNPEHPVFENKVVYNQGMPGAGINMQIDYAIDAIKSQIELKHIIVSIDFIDFLIKPLTSLQSIPNKNASDTYSFRLKTMNYSPIKVMKEKASLLFSIDALSSSFKTVMKQNMNASSIDSLGFNSAKSYVAIMNTEGIKPLFKQKLSSLNQRLKSETWKITSQPTPPYSPKFARIIELIELAEKKGIRLTFFINPYHASYLHTVNNTSQWSNFQQWKRTLVNLFSIYSNQNLNLWDFSSFSNIVTEKVDLNRPKKQMEWFWEPAHYKEELGSVILTTMLSNGSTSSFGTLITNNNIEQLLRNDTQELMKTRPQWKKLQQKLY